MPIMLFYRDNPSMRGKDPVGVIREGLAKTLVYYYPFAGRIMEGDNRKLMVDCNEEGVLFVEADANISIEQLGDNNILPPCPFMEEFLHDVIGSEGIIGCPILLIQVTRFIRGGFSLGIRFNHTMADAYGMIQLLTAITESVNGASTPSILPVWQRELYFTARSPPRITCTHNEYEQTPHDISYADIMDSDKLIRTAIFFSPIDIQALHNYMNSLGNFHRCSRFELITACLWKCRTIALSPADLDEVVRLSAITTARGKPLNIPTGYYGNAFTFPAAVSTAGILCTSPLSYAVHLIQKAKAQLSEEYIKSVADLMVIKKRPKYTTIWNLIVSDITRGGFDKVDFGWGKPEFGGIPFATSNISVCMNFKNWKGEDGVVVSICLPPSALQKFKYELKKLACYSIICRM